MSSLNVEQCDGVGRITLNRFGALNPHKFKKLTDGFVGAFPLHIGENPGFPTLGAGV